MQSPGMLWLRLEGLSSADTIKVVCQQLKVTSLPDVIATTVVQRSLGNPYFALELSRGVVECGILKVSPDGGACELAPVRWLARWLEPDPDVTQQHVPCWLV